jgi:hypothetical protein
MRSNCASSGSPWASPRNNSPCATALDLDAVRNWEHKRRKPDLAAQSYLRVTARLPDQASEAQEEAISE